MGVKKCLQQCYSCIQHVCKGKKVFGVNHNQRAHDNFKESNVNLKLRNDTHHVDDENMNSVNDNNESIGTFNDTDSSKEESKFLLELREKYLASGNPCSCVSSSIKNLLLLQWENISKHLGHLQDKDQINEIMNLRVDSKFVDAFLSFSDNKS